jgi:hypothetical protein
MLDDHMSGDEFALLIFDSIQFGMLRCGITKSGALVCRRDADAAGDRDARNVQ